MLGKPPYWWLEAITRFSLLIASDGGEQGIILFQI
jgi:hypothetical protein